MSKGRKGKRPTLQGPGQEADVSSLIGRDALDVTVESRVKARGQEGRLGEVGEAVTIKLVLEVLERQGVVEDDTVCEAIRTLLDDGGGSDEASRGDSGDGSG